MKFSTLKLIVRHFGVGWVAYRGWKSVSEKLGYWKYKLPSKPWTHFDSAKFIQQKGWQTAEEFFAQRKFFFDPESLDGSRDWLKSLDPAEQWGKETTARIAKGEFPYFSARWLDIGEQPNWFLNPYTQKTIPADAHFSEINEFGFGDVKCVWEASRFPFVFSLARCFGRTGDQQCAEIFWQHLEHWMDNNPPYAGVNWKCGQESGLRFIAAVFGLSVFSRCSANTPDRLERFVQLAAATANRIDKHIAYAISQKNNHGISEGVVLWTIGILFPELKQAEKWKSKGLQVLEQLCEELIYEDGAFSQHSANYHRLVLHLLAWTVRLAAVNEVQLSKNVLQRFDAAIHFISELINPETGKVPRYGSDDGALILPLNHCDYFDFRASVQLSQAVRAQPLPFGEGPWNEDLFWFGLQTELKHANKPSDSSTTLPIPASSPTININEQGGYHKLNHGNTTAFLRAGRFKHRPAQSDQMHVDISWKRHNIAIDPGTYSYNAPDNWKSIPLVQNRYHNSVIVDDKEPDALVSKFLLLPWGESELVAQHQTEDIVATEWKRKLTYNLATPVVHRRALVLLPQNLTLVFDSLTSDEQHDYKLGWLLGGTLGEFDQNSNLVSLSLDISIDEGSSKSTDTYYVHTSANCDSTTNYVRGEADSCRGWFSPRYMELESAISIHTQATAKQINFQTIFSPNKLLAEKHINTWLSESDFQPSILNPEVLTRLSKVSNA